MRTLSLLLVASMLVGVAEAGALPKELSYYGLIDALEQGDDDARAEAAVRLGRRGDPDAVELLADCAIADKDDRVRKHCVGAMYAIGHREGAWALAQVMAESRYRDARDRAEDLLSRLTDSMPEELVIRLLLTAQNDDTRRDMVTALANSPHAASEAVLAEVVRSDSSASVRRLAVQVLGSRPNLGTVARAAVRSAVVTDPDRNVRRSAVRVLRASPDAEALGTLVWALLDADEWVQREAVVVLVALDDPAALPGLRAAAKRTVYESAAREMFEAVRILKTRSRTRAAEPGAQTLPDSAAPGPETLTVEAPED